MILLLSSATKEGAIKLLNEYHHSTTYAIEGEDVYFKNPPVKNDGLICKVKRNRYYIYIR